MIGTVERGTDGFAEFESRCRRAGADVEDDEGEVLYGECGEPSLAVAHQWGSKPSVFSA